MTPETIARDLTPAQRDQMLNGLVGDHVTHELARRGLCWLRAKAWDFDEERMEEGGWKLRSLGLAVRAALTNLGVSDD